MQQLATAAAFTTNSTSAVGAPAGDLDGCLVTLNLTYGLKLINNISFLRDIDSTQQMADLLALASWSNLGCLARLQALVD